MTRRSRQHRTRAEPRPQAGPTANYVGSSARSLLRHHRHYIDRQIWPDQEFLDAELGCPTNLRLGEQIKKKKKNKKEKRKEKKDEKKMKQKGRSSSPYAVGLCCSARVVGTASDEARL